MNEYKYYNEDIKKRFMQFIEISKYPPKYWERLFDKSRMFEEKNDKDLYDFTADEIIEYYKFLDMGNITGLIVLNNNIIKYEQWALTENLIRDNQVHAIEISQELLYACINKVRKDNSLITFDELSAIHFINLQDAFIFWCLFEGIKGTNYQEIIKMQISDINDNKVKLCTGRQINVSNTFVKIATEANKETTYTTFGAGWDIPLKENEFIYKEKYNSRGDDIPRSVYAAISKNLRNVSGLNDNMSARSIRDSGLIHYLNLRAEELDTTVKSLLVDNQDVILDIINKYRFNTSTRTRFIEMYKEFLR